ncbi:hypothetical protein SDC9_194062 [bioreactor metagenome]|uniref:Uncharacterized protein n=1 Tax=bioreactor metagenome TaxID=1076179 RepID=A0A645I6F6_9ZZZZ
MLRVHAAAPQLDHLRTPGVDGREIEFLIAVQTAGALGLGGGQQTIGTDYLVLLFIADHQMLAEIVKDIDVVTRHGGLQHSPHFLGKDLVAQALSLANLVQMPGPAHLQAQSGRCSMCGTDRAMGKRGCR